MNSLQQLTLPQQEPVQVSTLKQHLRLNRDDEDSLLASYITTARLQFEHITGRQVMASTWRLSLEDWPWEVIYLPKAPVTSAIVFDDGVEVADAEYRVDYGPEPVRIDRVGNWDSRPLYVDFVAGYNTPEEVPQDIVVGIMLHSAMFYKYRESLIDKPLSELPFGFRAICDKYKLGIMGDWNVSRYV